MVYLSRQTPAVYTVAHADSAAFEVKITGRSPFLLHSSPAGNNFPLTPLHGKLTLAVVIAVSI
jgi:hypothetical protein